MNFYNKHYIRLDSQNRVIKGFSDAFVQPTETDICINEQGGQLFRIYPNGEENPALTVGRRMYAPHLYHYENGQVRKATDAELAAELAEIEAAKPPAQPTPIEELQAENKLLKAQVQAQTKRNDFMEDCIAEMAAQVYTA